jgi:hypothetical protein
MRSNLQRAVENEAKRIEKCLSDRILRTEKYAKMRLGFTDTITELQRRLELLEKIQKEATEAWVADEVIQATRHTAIVAAWNETITEALPVAPLGGTLAAPISAPVQTAPITAPMLVDLPDDFYLSTAAALPTDAPHIDFEKFANPQKLLLHHLWGGIVAWQALPGEAVVSFAELGGVGCAATAYDIIGEINWKRVYAKRTIVDADVVPRSLVTLLYCALWVIASKFQPPAAVAKEAKDRVEEASERSAKRRKEAPASSK